MCYGAAQRYPINVRATGLQQSHLLRTRLFVGIILGVILTLKMKLYIYSTVDFISLRHFIVGYPFDVYLINNKYVANVPPNYC